MKLEPVVKTVNNGMIFFDVALASGALFAPEKTLEVLIGHEPPSEDAKVLFQRCAPIWLTFAAAHLVAAKRNQPEDWWAVAWLRGTEIATDIIWSRSPAIRQKKTRVGVLWFAGVFNLALAAGAGVVATQSQAQSSSKKRKLLCCCKRLRRKN